MFRWTEEMTSMLIKLYPNILVSEISVMLNLNINQIKNKACRLGLKKSKDFKIKHSECLKEHTQTRFKKENIPWNLGKKGLILGPKHTKFQKGNVPINFKQIGTIRKNTYGLYEIKITKNKWILLHHKIWFDNYQKYPLKTEVIIFIDGNRENVDINNLQLILKADLMKKYTFNRFPKALQECILLSNRLQRTLNKNG